MPSEAMTRVSPTRKLLCMTLSFQPGGSGIAGGSGLSAKRISISGTAPIARW